MTSPSPKIVFRRRGVLLLIMASLAAVAPATGRHGMEARADDGGDSGGNSGSGSGSDNSGSDDGGSDDGGGDDGGGGNDDGGSDDGGSDNSGSDNGGGSGGSGSGRGNSGTQGSKGGSQPSGPGTTQRDGALAVRLKGRIAPISEVEAIAGRTVPGEIIDVRLYRNKDLYVYKVKIIQRSGSIYDVRINAMTRKVLSARER